MSPPPAEPPEDAASGPDIAFYQAANAELLRKLKATGADPDEPVTMLLIRRATAAAEERFAAAAKSVQELGQDLARAQQALKSIAAERADLKARIAEMEAEHATAMTEVLGVINTMITQAAGRLGKDGGGVEEWLFKSGLLDGDFYLASYPDVANGQLDQAYHYLNYGMKEGRLPRAVFAPAQRR